jgi:hypothetical protein
MLIYVDNKSRSSYNNDVPSNQSVKIEKQFASSTKQTISFNFH